MCRGGTLAATFPEATVGFFLSSLGLQGNLGGLAGADAKCQLLADAASLGGTYKAWLSDSNTRVDARLHQSSVPYVLVDSTPVANDWTDLVTRPFLDSYINKTELGIVVVPPPNPTPARAWTGTTIAAPGGNANITVDLIRLCSDWTDSTNLQQGGRVGLGAQTPNGIPYEWANGTANACFSPTRLYCFEQ